MLQGTGSGQAAPASPMGHPIVPTWGQPTANFKQAPCVNCSCSLHPRDGPSARHKGNYLHLHLDKSRDDDDVRSSQMSGWLDARQPGRASSSGGGGLLALNAPAAHLRKTFQGAAEGRKGSSTGAADGPAQSQNGPCAGWVEKTRRPLRGPRRLHSVLTALPWTVTIHVKESLIVSASRTQADMAEKSQRRPASRPGRYKYEQFNRSKQLRRLCVTSLVRWLMTAALAASIYCVLWSYSSRNAMASSKRREFNTLIIGLSLALGLNIASALKANVTELRWWLLSLRETSPREVDLILQSENLSRLVTLGCVSRRLPVQMFVLVWVLLNVFTVTSPGIVSIPDLSTIQTFKVLSSKSSQALSTLRYTANNYGLVALSYGFATADQIPAPGTLYNQDTNLAYCSDTDCRFVFFESTTSNASYESNAATNRYVSTSAKCESWRVLSGGDGNMENITIDDADKTVVGPLPAENGPDQTLFLNDPEEPSGDTWSVVRAFEASTTDPWFYQCNVSVGPVVNAVIKEHRLGVNITRMAPPAIALQGYGASTTGVSNSTKQYQFQSYPAESFYGLPMGGDTGLMSIMMARFSIGMIGVTALSNSNIDVPGMVPLKAIMLEINRWKYVYLILGLTVGLQLFFAVISVLVANRVQVRGHSHLAMAMLLRPALQDVGYRAASASGRQVAAMMAPGARLSYAPERGGGYHFRSHP
ncbi:hypothetical protein TOPH_06932 [Tolypocladium ophioglossoides CBS 100239]|uniref:Uncharacterized protein n=1 Tax=Tolypocladium ophioglossoides (strain CBS 100239) TaxID=1163406 RepID=A0A0L0N2L6_TOLOC|nr:hypothetical protein TOPH_06932 [Tolypocladium ophioglossoides CBS 100239]